MPGMASPRVPFNAESHLQVKSFSATNTKPQATLRTLHGMRRMQQALCLMLLFQQHPAGFMLVHLPDSDIHHSSAASECISTIYRHMPTVSALLS